MYPFLFDLLKKEKEKKKKDITAEEWIESLCFENSLGSLKPNYKLRL